jgi:hypothetical protein
MSPGSNKRVADPIEKRAVARLASFVATLESSEARLRVGALGIDSSRFE